MASRGAEYDRTGATDDTAAGVPSPSDASTAGEARALDPNASDAKALDPKIAAAIAAAEAAGPQRGETVRVDSWIWSVRLVKTRSLGATACRGGHVRVNGERVKPAHAVRV
ncbi:S4 domain-containing protein, partial [Streptomyces sp. NPDC006129]|uniref:S4 domain-containing protein n=1 Tax=Streptomyces sp. NPDC006129 TaxID=3155348 RepID=UPI0033B43AFD